NSVKTELRAAVTPKTKASPMATSIIPEPSMLSPLTRTDAVNEIGGNRFNHGLGPEISFTRELITPADWGDTIAIRHLACHPVDIKFGSPRPLVHTGLVDADVAVIGAGALGLSTALHCALAGRRVAVVERHTAGSQASGRAAGLFKSVQADELRTRLARRSIDKAVGFADWAGVPLEVARPGSFLIARTAQHRDYL